MRAAVSEGWVLASPGMFPDLREDVCGMPYVLRLAADLALAGARTISVVWRGPTPPVLDDLASDPRLRGATLQVVTSSPAGSDDDAILVVRADRIYHRDLPKLVASAWTRSTATLVKIDGSDMDAVVVTTRRHARTLVDAIERGEITATLASLPGETVPSPYLGFTVPAADRRALRRAEKQLVWSQRKEAQGIAAYWINRHFSLPVTRAIMRTNILPNHVTVFCFVLAVAGGIVMAQGGYACGLAGMVIVNLGSILDGVDGELARLKYRFSNIGAWLDTLADDFGNVAYVLGAAINLDRAGVTWALPLAFTALACFAITQGTQYFLITRVYRSGDLAAIPWAFQSNEFLTARPDGFVAWVKATLPKTLKRDFALTMFVVFAAIAFLEGILVVFSAGAIVFFAVFAVQLARNLRSVREQMANVA